MDNEGCKAKNKKGEPCKADPNLVVDGLCPAHRPGGRADQVAKAKKGAEATNQVHRRPGLTEAELGELETHEDAKRWLRLIGSAVVSGKLTNKDGSVGIQAVKEWVKAHEGELTAKVVDDLKEEMETLKREVKRGPRAVA